MKEYSPKRRTAAVFTGTGVSGAYHAGVLKAFEESGFKIDIMVGSGVGTIAAAFGAVAGGARLFSAGGFWPTLRGASLYRLRPEARALQLLMGVAFGVFVLPLILAVIAALFFPLILLADFVSPGVLARFAAPWPSLEVMRPAYVAALALPAFLLFGVGGAWLLYAAVRDRRLLLERFEHLVDASPARALLRGKLWEVVRGADVAQQPPRDAVLGERYVALNIENRGQLGFHELIVRAADLDSGQVHTAVLLGDAARDAFLTARGSRRGGDAVSGLLDLTATGAAGTLFPTVLTGLLPPLVTPPERLAFPKGATHAGETHRLVEATLLGGCGIAEAIDAGAEQIVVVAAVAEKPSPPLRRRGPRALADALLESLERDAFERELAECERFNRLVETLGHRHEGAGAGRAWQDPATGRLYRDISIYVVRPQARSLRPFDHEGTRDPATEVEETLGDLLQRGHADAFRLFIEPVVGAAPVPSRAPDLEEEGQPIEL